MSVTEETPTERRLRETLEKVVALLHDASQFRETPERPNYIRVTPLLEIIGDTVRCPDCFMFTVLYDENGERRDPNDLTDKEAAAALRWDQEHAEEQELDRRLRERP